jgi:membrane dipeptidase
MYIVDAHEDLAWNMLTFGRDYTKPAAVTHLAEAGSLAQAECGDTLLGWDEYQAGKVCLVFSTLFASPIRRSLGDWDTEVYKGVADARTVYRRQLDAYHRLCDRNPDKFRFIYTRMDATQILDGWKSDDGSEHTIGLVALMEGAEAIGDPGELEVWWQAGLRIIGLAWTGTRFCGGSWEPGPLTSDGYALLDAMAGIGFTLDISHMDEPAVLQALDHFPNTVIASHANVKALLKGIETNRHLSDEVIHQMVERDGVIGVVPVNPFLKVGWKKNDPIEDVGLERVVAHIDYVCQIAGDARHVGLGTDYDGGFGVQDTPHGIDSIADLQKLIPLLAAKGYAEQDIQAIMGGNWVDRLQVILPETT